MSKTYDPNIHSFVIVKHPTEKDGWDYPMPILLHVGTHVWMPGCYSMHEHPEVTRVGNVYDDQGNCILAVPSAWCSYYTDEEADGIALCIDADERLLSYAR